MSDGDLTLDEQHLTMAILLLIHTYGRHGTLVVPNAQQIVDSWPEEGSVCIRLAMAGDDLVIHREEVEE